jgi:hypothetical protein
LGRKSRCTESTNLRVPLGFPEGAEAASRLTAKPPTEQIWLPSQHTQIRQAVAVIDQHRGLDRSARGPVRATAAAETHAEGRAPDGFASPSNRAASSATKIKPDRGTNTTDPPQHTAIRADCHATPPAMLHPQRATSLFSLQASTNRIIPAQEMFLRRSSHP